MGKMNENVKKVLELKGRAGLYPANREGTGTSELGTWAPSIRPVDKQRAGAEVPLYTYRSPAPG